MCTDSISGFSIIHMRQNQKSLVKNVQVLSGFENGFKSSKIQEILQSKNKVCHHNKSTNDLEKIHKYNEKFKALLWLHIYN